MDMFDLLVKSYKDENWREYIKNVKPSSLKVKGVQQDIVDAAVYSLGHSGANEWLRKPNENHLRGKSPIEVLKERNGEKALKALIMRLP